MNNNALQIKTFDPSVLIGKVVYELDNILQYFDLEDWADTDHTPKVPIVNETESIKSVSKEDLKTDASLIRRTIHLSQTYQIWQTLQQVHTGDDVTRRNQLIDETNTLRYNPKTRFFMIFNKIKLKYMNVVVTDEEKKLLLFNSLPEEYQSEYSIYSALQPKAKEKEKEEINIQKNRKFDKKLKRKMSQRNKGANMTISETEIDNNKLNLSDLFVLDHNTSLENPCNGNTKQHNNAFNNVIENHEHVEEINYGNGNTINPTYIGEIQESMKQRIIKAKGIFLIQFQKIKASDNDVFEVCIKRKNILCNNVNTKENVDICEICMQLQMKNEPYGRAQNNSRKILELIHIDLVREKLKEKEFFLGYNGDSPGYKIFDIDKMKIYVKRVVEFLEDQPRYDNVEFINEQLRRKKLLPSPPPISKETPVLKHSMRSSKEITAHYRSPPCYPRGAASCNSLRQALRNGILKVIEICKTYLPEFDSSDLEELPLVKPKNVGKEAEKIEPITLDHAFNMVDFLLFKQPEKSESVYAYIKEPIALL
ncbi:hypothetical protein H8356DRAFT_1328785 [Neocallimastix lanati (nom. inval.)]|nr:hypothetical protein H8356DRAFT_1328785 [Neocallimastix sp. JGI-2020a]